MTNYSLFEVIEMKKLIITDFITFNENKFDSHKQDKLLKEVADFAVKENLAKESFFSEDELVSLSVSKYFAEILKGERVENVFIKEMNPDCRAFIPDKNTFLIRYDRFVNSEDAIKFKEYIDELFKKDIYIKSQSWQCEKKNIERWFMLNNI